MSERRIVVVGLGTIGLPTACLLAAGGASVIGVESNAARRDDLLHGEPAGPAVELRDILLKTVASGAFSVSDEFPQADSYLVCVQTPVDANGKPDLRALDGALASVGQSMAEGALVIVESTLPPGGSPHAVAVLEGASKKRRGAGFEFAYAPERVLPGNIIAEIRSNARIVGAYSPEAARRTEEIMRFFIGGEIHHTDPATAELVKLAENAYRMVNVGFANELAGLCEKLGADAREVIRLANLHPRVKILEPGPGVGGPCLPKDPLLLAHGHEADSQVIRAALDANAAARERLLSQLRSGMKEGDHKMGGSKVLVLGVAYKGGVGDSTDSPGLWLASQLRKEGATPVLADPLSSIPGQKIERDPYVAARGCVAAVICSDHQEYRALDLPRLMEAMGARPVLVDSRGLIAKAPGLVFRALGRSTR